jgi:hypothetical protein
VFVAGAEEPSQGALAGGAATQRQKVCAEDAAVPKPSKHASGMFCTHYSRSGLPSTALNILNI